MTFSTELLSNVNHESKKCHQIGKVMKLKERGVKRNGDTIIITSSLLVLDN